MHSSQRGVISGQDLLTSVAELEGVVSGYLHDDEAEPVAVLLDVAAAFPSAERTSIRWALTAQGVPTWLVESLSM